MYEELKKLADLRLDVLNMTFNRPAETAVGKDFVRKTDQTLAGKWYRFKQWFRNNYGGIGVGSTAMGIIYFTYDIIKAAVSATRTVSRHGYRASAYVLKKAYQYASSGAVAASNVTSAAYNYLYGAAKLSADILKTGADTAKFLADNTISLFVALVTIIGILFSIYSSRK